jgi:hypothetical protein
MISRSNNGLLGGRAQLAPYAFSTVTEPPLFPFLIKHSDLLSARPTNHGSTIPAGLLTQ